MRARDEVMELGSFAAIEAIEALIHSAFECIPELLLVFEIEDPIGVSPYKDIFVALLDLFNLRGADKSCIVFIRGDVAARLQLYKNRLISLIEIEGRVIVLILRKGSLEELL